VPVAPGVLQVSEEFGESLWDPKTRTFGELIDLEEGRTARAVVLGVLAELDR